MIKRACRPGLNLSTQGVCLLDKVVNRALVGMTIGAAAGFVVALLPGAFTDWPSAVVGLAQGAIGGTVAGALEPIVESWIGKE